ncbi:MAG TPA: UpxY family transcription antiterminator [Bacteroidales bacterium]|jgi:transcription antitermination factor NusG|nr:UpxY family transcription antiterminator [Bacteroidota bacterium]OQC60806.1 MAG: Transcription antitermination protein RfaH [Bacteroidetes bacterium ADurb.Bin012]HNQ59634.1 UpxY family transcription antiterminator [Bacteroidales bacterium]HNV16770.1 UpxY family transcription antiterminator [Bacteroidales bacterium]HNZ78933.1 UpxY family transcription antiterminator [Bacteroidales bacterium]
MDNLLRWYAVYTRSRYEKKSAFLLNEQGIEAYVPLRRVLRQWSDRRKLVFEPVIHSYVFVKANKMLYEKVLGIEGVVRYIYFGGKPAPIPDRQIETMKTVVGTDLEIECTPDCLKPGMHVIVTEGPLAGMEGELVQFRGKQKVAVRIQAIQQVIMVTLSPLILQPVQNTTPAIAL